MTKIYLIRHAEAEGNIFRRMHGWYDSSVTPNGLRQIEALRKRFAEIPIDAVYSSDLVRTQTTAAAIWKPKGLTLQTDSRFREIHVGVWEDLPFGQLGREAPEANRAFSKDPQHWHVERAETYDEYVSRFMQALEEVVRRHERKSVAIFSHGMVLRSVIAHLFCEDSVSGLGHSENTAVSEITWRNGAYRLDYLFDAKHLPQELTTLGRQMWWRGREHQDMNFWYRPATEEERAALDGVQSGDHAFIAMQEENVAGAVVLRDDGSETGLIVHLGLLPQYRRRGLAPQLLGCAVSAFRTEGKTMLRLAQKPPEEARAFFVRFRLSESMPVSLVPQIR